VGVVKKNYNNSMSRVYGGVVSSVKTLDATTINTTGNINFPAGGDILGANLIECNIISASNISGDLNPVNETLTNTTLSGFTHIIGGDLTFLTGDDILGVDDIVATGDVSADGFIRCAGNLVSDGSGSVAGNFYAQNIYSANDIQATGTITCNTLNYTTLNPPVSTSLGLGQILQNSNDASGQDISNIGDIYAHTNADFHIRNLSTNGDMLLETVRDLEISSGNAMTINSTAGMIINSTDLDCGSDNVLFSNREFEVNTICGIIISSDLPQPAYGVQILADPLTSFGEILIKAGQPGGNIDVDTDTMTFTRAQSKIQISNGVLSAYSLRTTNMNNAGDFATSSTQGAWIDLEGGYRNSLNWLYMIARSNVGSTLSYGRIAVNKAYFFTGQHPILLPAVYDISSNHYGLIVSSDVNYSGYIQPPVVNDAHIQAKLSDIAEDKNVYGVLSYYDFPIQTGYDAEIPVENPDTKLYYSNSTGEGMIYVCDLCGNISAGDYITSCDIPGLGLGQSDDLKHSYTIAKVVGDIDFNHDHYFSYWEYDDPSNPDRTLTEIHKSVSPKYVVRYGRVYADKYVVYSNRERTEEYFTIQYDFASTKPHFVGTEFKCVLVGCVYQN
jgi:hypothetical protein